MTCFRRNSLPPISNTSSLLDQTLLLHAYRLSPLHNRALSPISHQRFVSCSHPHLARIANVPDKGLLTAEAVTLASQLVNRQITASGLIDQGFNRLSTFNKDNLPNWFLDDEAKFYKPNIPITKEAINALREKQRALDARPIKKVAEAKARKKFKAHQRMEKARKKADGVMDTEDLNEAEKARQVGKVMGRAGGKPKLPDKKIVIARGANKGVKGRPKGVKGRYKIVDARMRKEVSGRLNGRLCNLAG